MSNSSVQFKAGKMQACVFATEEEVGEAAARNTTEILSNAIEEKGAARVIFATGNSQLAFTKALCRYEDVSWEKVTVFHLDEYAGITASHPASFRRWIREQVANPLCPATVHYMQGDTEDLEAECHRYEELLKEAPIDLVCMGIGENGHIAFNDPPVADFEDPVWVKVVELDYTSRQQQVGEGHFSSVEDVPVQALSLTVPALLAPKWLQVLVPEQRKSGAIRRTIEDPISAECPATVLRQHSRARLFLDTESASEISTG